MTKKEFAMWWFIIGFFVGVVVTAAIAYILFSLIFLHMMG